MSSDEMISVPNLTPKDFTCHPPESFMANARVSDYSRCVTTGLREPAPPVVTLAMSNAPCPNCSGETPPGRRGFLKGFLAGAIATVLGLVPLGAGLSVLLDPLRRKSAASASVRVTTLDALPGDGVPRKFPVLANRTDAWNKFQQVPIGAVYLRRNADGHIQAFNVVCPHAGCYVDFQADKDNYLCPCHNSSFTLEGRIDSPNSPSPRGLDPLEVEVRNKNEVWVHFQNFQTGRAERVPVA